MSGKSSTTHKYTIDHRVLSVDEGFILGNGDLSVSIYQRDSEIVWRFGKGDVWDRRHPFKDDPEPLTMDELRHGLCTEGWTCPAYGGKKQALNGTQNPQRMLEALNFPPSQTYPYPTPKPVGELSLRWPGDMHGLEITQTLILEQASVKIECLWPDGEKLLVDCFVHPDLNVLVVNWNLQNWHPGSPQPFFKDTPVLLSLYRWADPTISAFAAEWISKYNYHGFDGVKNSKATPLPHPCIVEHDGSFVVEQKFYPDPLFPQGFQYWLGCITDQPSIEKADTGILGEARLFVSSESSTSLEDMCDFIKIDQPLRDGTLDYPPGKDYEGWLVVPVTTSSDNEGAQRQFDKIKKMLSRNPESVVSTWEKENIKAAEKFWSASSITLAEPVIESLWRNSLHVSRSIYKQGTVTPGLYIPSTISDYCMWHGDYHTNYNIQQPFWGFIQSNHPELAAAFFDIADFMGGIGRKIASQYCGTRGLFIQISNYPISPEADPMPTSPMSRMAYMTGWVPELFWWYYLSTCDMEFLRSRAYPFIRDCALFYMDFLKLGDDGLYHAFPSCWGEEGYDGDIATSTDALQTMDYAASCMKMALKAAKILNIDCDLQKDWQERIDKLAPGKGESEWRPLDVPDKQRHNEFNMPAFRPGDNYRFPNKWPLSKRWWGWIDKLTISMIRDIRGGQFDTKRDLPELVKVIKRWQHDSGIIRPMPVRFYGRAGCMTEALGIIAPIEEMLIQSWDDVISIFPAWPTNVDAKFSDLRTQGGFLVSAELTSGVIGNVKIKSLAGKKCKLANLLIGRTLCVIDAKTGETICEEDSDIVEFTTKLSREYRITNK